MNFNQRNKTRKIPSIRNFRFFFKKNGILSDRITITSLLLIRMTILGITFITVGLISPVVTAYSSDRSSTR